MRFFAFRPLAVVSTSLAVAALFNPACSSDSEDDGGTSHKGGKGGTAGASSGAGGEGASADGGTSGSAGRGGASGQGGTGTSGAAGAGGDIAGAGPGGEGGQAGAGGGGVEVTLTMYRGTVQANAALVAWQDGDSAWQELTGGGGLYRFTPQSGRYSLSIVCVRDKLPDPGQAVTSTSLRALTSEITSIARACFTTPPVLPLYNVTVNVSGLTTGMTANAYVGATLLGYSPSVTTHSLMLSQGLQPVLVTRYTSAVLDRFLYSPGNDIRSVTTLNFDPTANGVAPTSGTFTATGGVSPDPDLAVDAYSSDGQLVNTFYSATTTSATYYALPASELAGNAVQFASAVSFDSATRRNRSIGRYAKGFTGAITLAVPDSLAAPTASIVSSNRVVLELPRRAGTQIYSASTSQTVGTDNRSTTDYVTAGYAGVGPVVLESPDLGDLDGWDASYAFVSGTNISWSLNALSTNREVADAFANVRQLPSNTMRADLDGLELANTSAAGTILP